ncbi:MAG: MmcQ/YjbR family DNA-binding protein [Nocardioidaceae bacterium]|nr:MmcQ/YjbR family DNA-binding protein [Nocardioidaceae bacterium]
MPVRPEVPGDYIAGLRAILDRFARCEIEDAWVGARWRVGGATVAHVFGGEDQLVRIVFRAEPAEVMAFQHLGAPYFKTEWGANVVGLVLDESTDWEALAELLTDSYCLQAPQRLADQIARPPD